MSFVYPWFLWALTALSVPIIIHLFNFRRYKKVYFTNVRFLKELQIESKSKSRLKELLILLMRCLTLAALVLAFAQPVMNKPTSDISAEKAVSIYLDNSFSTENIGKLGPILQLEKTTCKDILNSYPSTTRFQIITNDFEGKHQRLLTKQDALTVLDEIKPSAATRKLSSVIKRQISFLKTTPAPAKKIYVLSDAQKSTFDLVSCEPDTAIPITLLPLEVNAVNNAYVDSCWFDTPVQQKGQILSLHATIVNKSNKPIEAGSARLYVNNQQVALSSFSAMPNETRQIDFKFECKTNGFNFASIKLDDYPITFDDELFFSFNSRVSISALLINGRSQPASNPFTQLFKSDSLFRFETFSEQSIDYSSFKLANIIVLNALEAFSSGLQSELNKFVKQGGSLLIVPSRSADVLNYNALLSQFNMPLLSELDTTRTRLADIDSKVPFFTGVFDKMDERMNVPTVFNHFPLLKSSRSDFESILQLLNGDDFIGVSTSFGGNCYLIASSLEDESSNFGKHALFVPSVYKMCLTSLKQSPLYYQVSNNQAIAVKKLSKQSEEPIMIKALTGNSEIIPEARLFAGELRLFTQYQVMQPGFYHIVQSDSVTTPLAFNYSRIESDLSCYTMSELEAELKQKGWKNVSLINSNQSNLAQTLLEYEQGKHLWKLFIFLALLFVGIEILLLRVLK